MDTNQVGSINFDANALYLEEDSEHEDDKQQDNEVIQKITDRKLIYLTNICNLVLNF